MVSTAKNTFYLFVAYIYQKLIALFYFILLARYLGAESFGKYTFAISFATLFSVFITFGLLPVLTREIARNKAKTKAYFGNVLSFNLLAGVFVLFLIYVFINVLDYPLITRRLVYLSGLIVFLDSLALCLYQVFRGHLNLKFESIGIIVHKTAMLIAGLILMSMGVKLIWMLLPLIFASLFYLTNAIAFLKRKLDLWPIPRFDKSNFKFLIGLALPFFIAGLFAKLYATSDTILLSYLSNDTYVGYYTAAQKLAIAFLMLIAGSISTALYPSFSYYFVRSKSYLSQLFHQGIFYLMLIAIPLVFGLLVLARPVILFIYGIEYMPAVSALMFLALSIPFMFLDYVLAGFLNSADMQKTNTIVHGIGAVIFVVLNIIFIPLWYHTGAAAAVLIAFVILFFMEIYYAAKVVQIRWEYFFKKLGSIFTAALIMGLILLAVKDMAHVVVTVFIGAVIYFVVAYILGLIKKQELLFLKKIIRFK